MMKKKTSTKSAKSTRLLLTGYWGYRMINGGDFLKTTLSVLQMDQRLKAREKQRSAQTDPSDHKDRRGPGSRRTSVAGSIFLWNIVKKILRKARVF